MDEAADSCKGAFVRRFCSAQGLCLVQLAKTFWPLRTMVSGDPVFALELYLALPLLYIF